MPCQTIRNCAQRMVNALLTATEPHFSHPEKGKTRINLCQILWQDGMLTYG